MTLLWWDNIYVYNVENWKVGEDHATTTSFCATNACQLIRVVGRNKLDLEPHCQCSLSPKHRGAEWISRVGQAMWPGIPPWYEIPGIYDGSITQGYL